MSVIFNIHHLKGIVIYTSPFKTSFKYAFHQFRLPSIIFLINRNRSVVSGRRQVANDLFERILGL